MKKRTASFSCISTVCLSGILLALYKKTGDKGFLCPLSLTLLKLPISRFTVCQKKELTEENVEEELAGFKKWNWLKTSVDLLAFTAVICTVLYKK